MVKFLIFLNSLIFVINTAFGINYIPKGYALDSKKIESKVTASTEERIESGKLTGAHAVVMQNNEIIFDKIYGLYGVDGKELDNNAIYRIASMTKPITAVALLIEQDRGHLSIYDNLADYLPEFKDMYIAKKDTEGNIVTDENGLAVKGEKATTQIKLYELVSHFSGIGEVSVSYIGSDSCNLDTACEFLAAQPLNFNPGSESQYSTGAFDVAAKVIEKTSGMEFSEYIKVNIFDKLGMVDTTFEPTEAQWARFVSLHNMEDNKAVNANTTPGCIFGNFPAKYHAAGAALCSTTSDYLKFAAMLLNEGTGLNGTKILSAEAVKLMRTPVPDEKGNGTQLWGLAVRVISKADNTLPAGSFGWSGAYGSHFWIDPTNKVAAVYMKNSAYDGGAGNASASEFEEDIMNSFTLKHIK